MLFYLVFFAIMLPFVYYQCIRDEKERQDQEIEYLSGLVAVEMVKNEFPNIPELNILDNPLITESPLIFSSFHKVLNTPCSVTTAAKWYRSDRPRSCEENKHETSDQAKLFTALQSEFTDTPIIEPWKNLLKVSRNSAQSSNNEECEPTDLSRTYTNKFEAIQQEAQVSPQEKLKQKLAKLKEQRAGTNTTTTLQQEAQVTPKVKLKQKMARLKKIRTGM